MGKMFIDPMGRQVSYGEAAAGWARSGFDLNPNDGSTTKRGAAPASQGGSTLSLGGMIQPGSQSMGGGSAAPPVGGSMGGLMGGGSSGGYPGAGSLTDIADPWSSQRGQYQTQLADLMKNPGAFSSSPMFKAATDAGIEAVNRSAASKGMLSSGNRLQALMDYGQKNAPDNFFKMADLLSGLGGAKNQNPGGGLAAQASLANAETGQYNAQTNRLAQQQGVTEYADNQTRQQKAATDALSQWQQQQMLQQQQDAYKRQQEEFARLDAWAR